MAVTIDPRPTVFGDRMIITGSYEAGDTSIDLSSQLASIDAYILNPSAPNVANHQDVDVAGGSSYTARIHQAFDSATVSGTTITVSPAYATQTTKAGTFLAIGRRS
tara:strand:+ start:143 stop:460 length:318 start_codon:yes stop_codon:yes gene_type:complete